MHPSRPVSTDFPLAPEGPSTHGEFATRTTRLSQVSHDTGEYVKKPLSQRWHVFADGSRVQRDMYSAWLARFVEGDRLAASQCRAQWAAAEPLLRRAASGFDQSVSGAGFARPHVRPSNRGGVGADRPLQRGWPPDRGCGCCSASESRREVRCRHLQNPLALALAVTHIVKAADSIC